MVARYFFFLSNGPLINLIQARFLNDIQVDKFVPTDDVFVNDQIRILLP